MGMHTELSLKKRNRVNIAAVFAVFFVILLIQHSFVYFYFDDYGYASLSFINNIPNVSGTHFTFRQFTEFYMQHYLNITGRIFSQSIVTLVLAAGVWCARIVQCIAITLILYIIYVIVCRTAKKKADPVAIAVIVCVLYGLIEIFMLDRSIYWFTASGTYMWPIAPLLFGCWMYYRSAIEGAKLNKPIQAVILICLFFAASAQEQLALVTGFIMIVLAVAKLLKTKKLALFDILAVACTLGGMLFILLSPSNEIRIAKLELEPSYVSYVTMPIVQRALYGIRIVLCYVFSRNFYLIVLALLFCGAFAGWRLILNKKGVMLLNTLLFVVCIGSVAAMACTGEGLFIILTKLGFSDKLAYAVIIFLLLLLLYGFAAYYRIKKSSFIPAAFLAGGISIFSVVPSFIPSSARLYIPFVFLSLLLIGDIAADFLLIIKKKRIKAAALGFAVIIAACNMFSTTLQVYNTSAMNAENDRLLRSVSERIKSGETIDVVDIHLYPNIESDALNPGEGTMTVYRPETVACIKEYYELPPEILLNFQDK